MKEPICNWEETKALSNELSSYVLERIGNVCNINHFRMPQDDGKDLFFMPLDHFCAPYFVDGVLCDDFKMISLRLFAYSKEDEKGNEEMAFDVLIDFAERYTESLGWTTTDSDRFEDCILTEQILIASLIESMTDEDLSKYITND